MSAVLLDALRAAAEHAAEAENAFRRDSAQRITVLERERAFAFRKLNLMRAVMKAVGAAAKPDEAVAAGVAALRDELGWVGASAARTEVLERFAAVVAALVPADDGVAADRPDPGAALADFEAWYVETHPLPFWALFDQYVSETPVVDF